jgi:heterodisulfide reductase subunit B
MVKEFAFFVGCTTLGRLGNYELSTRKIVEALGIKIVDLDFGCCGTTHMDSIDRNTALALAARNICLAEEKGLDILTLCNGCYEVLSKTNKALKEEKETRAKVNEILADVNKKFNGTIEVKHLVRMLIEDVGIKHIADQIKTPFHDLKVAVHYGCHLLRPHDVLLFDDHVLPKSLDNLVNVTGAVSVTYPNKLECCTAAILGIREELSSSIALEKVVTAQKYADVIVTSCPFCYLQYETSQLTASESPNVPVILYPQLLGLALGLDFETELALTENRIDTSKIKEFVK